MGKKLTLDFEAADFDAAVDEVDVLVPHYLEALQALNDAQDFADLPAALRNVESYWERLGKLFRQLEPLESEIPFREIMLDTLQTELSILEQVYLRINLRIEFGKEQWTPSMWKAADQVLERMEVVLEGLGFAENHEDRRLIREMVESNKRKSQQSAK